MPPTPSPDYRRIRHAAHTGPEQGWDLEEWHVRQTWGEPRPDAVPRDAERHRGYLDDGEQVVIYVRRAPLTGDCAVCHRARLRRESERMADDLARRLRGIL